MGKVRKIWDTPCFTALSWTIVLLGLFLYTSPVLSLAGDINISEYLSSSKVKVGFFFISPALAGFLRILNDVYCANWWSIFSISEMMIGLYTFIWYLNKRYRNHQWIVRFLLSELFCIFYWEAILKYQVNFTQTACITSLSGALWIIDSCCEHRQVHWLRYVKVVWGIGLMLLSGAIRWKAALLMLPFELMGLVYFCIVSYFQMDNRKDIVKAVVAAEIMISVVLVSWGLHTAYFKLNRELGEYVEANALREEIADYVDRYPSYEEEKMTYEERGIKRSWMNMLYAFITGDANHFGSIDLKIMLDLKQTSKKTVKEYVDTLKGHKLMWAAVSLLVGGIVIRKGWRSSLLPLLGCVLSFFMVSVYFVYIGRFVWRVTNGCILACIISFVIMTSWFDCHAVHFRLNLSVKTGILVIIVMMFFAEGSSVKKENSRLVAPKATVSDEDMADTLAYMDANSDILYLTIDSGFRFYSAYNMWAYHEPDYLKNSFSLVAHFIMGGKETLSEMGINDLMNDMLEQPDIYCKYSPVRNKVFYDYLKDYYEPCVSLSVVDSYKDVKFLRYAKPVIPDQINEKNIKVNIKRADEFSEDQNIIDTISVSFEIDGIENDYNDFFLNITDKSSELVYSYGLKFDKTSCYADIIQMKSTWGRNVSVCLIGQDSDGNFDMITDLSDMFVQIISE